MGTKYFKACLLLSMVTVNVMHAQILVKPLPTVNKEEYEQGCTPGDHTQHMLDFTYCASAPDRIYMAQDVASVWVSRNFGKNWNTLSNTGLLSPFIISVEADPLDKNRVLAAVQCRHYDAVNKTYQGIYMTTDGGITWQRKAIRQDLGEVRSSTKLIGYAPSTINEKAKFARRWYAAFGEYKALGNGKAMTADDGLLYSDDGGETWNEICKLPEANFGGQIRGLKVHPRNADRVFIYGEKGLFVFDEATKNTGNWSRLSGVNGLPEGDIYGRLYISQDGNTLIVAVSGKGIYKSVDDGKTWATLYDWGLVNYCYVNERFPDVIYAVPIMKSHEQILISRNGGSTWESPASVNYRPGYNDSFWNTRICGEFTCIIPDPRNPDKVFAHTNSKNFRSDDGGRNWYPSDNGYNGGQHAGIGLEQMFDPVNPDRFCYFMVDKGVVFTDSRGRWFYPNTIAPKEMGLIHKTSSGGALHPDGSTKVILASAGSGPMGHLLRSEDDGRTWKIVASSGNQPRWVIAFDLQNPDYCYQWRERSSDAGKTWKEMPNMPEGTMVCGISRTDGKIIYAMDNLRGGKNVWRSDDRGDTWKLVIESPWDLTTPGADQKFVFRVHPQNPDIVFTSSKDGQITRWDLSKDGNGRQTDLDVGIPDKENLYFKLLAIDARYPDVMYVLNQRANTGYKLFRTTDGGTTWENISEWIPQGSTNGLTVSPVTGEVYISSQNGSLVMLPPYPTSRTAYEIVSYVNNHLNKPYGDE